jgi:hypothetical protein
MPRIPATVVSTLSVRRIGANLAVLAAGLICTQFLQACSDVYAGVFHGYDRAHLDSLVLPGRFVGDTSGITFHLRDFTVGSIVRTEYDDSMENRGSGGFAAWIRRNPNWEISLIRDGNGQTSPRYNQLKVYVDSINPYKSDPRRGIVGAHLGNHSWDGDGTRLAGTIESSIAMDEVIADHKPFTFTISLRDTSGLFIVLTDSALLWTEYHQPLLFPGGM